MSDYYEQGSFRNVEFDYIDDDYIYRKKNADDLLLSDENDDEELGEKPREFTLKCAVSGKTARKKRNALIAALEKSEAGILVHPQYGRIKVKVQKDGYVCHGSAAEGNYYEFDITFVKVSNKQMALTVLPVKVSAADELSVALAEAKETVSAQAAAVLKKKSWYDKMMSGASGLAAEFGDFVSGVTSAVSSLTSFQLLPFDSVASVMGSLTLLGSSAGSLLAYPNKFVESCFGVFDGVVGTFDFFKSLARFNLNFLPAKDKYATPSNAEKKKQQQAVVDLISNIGTILAVKQAAFYDETTAQEEKELTAAEVAERKKELTELVESVVDNENNAAAPELQEAFETLLQKAVAALEERQTLKTRDVFVPVCVPAVVLLYEECGRSALDKLDDFVRRNGISDSLFVGGDQTVEVVDD